ncbi:hypothetical protein [Bosea vaviloviae]|nr:hypothetical protein [Bosea vaviloviae]
MPTFTLQSLSSSPLETAYRRPTSLPVIGLAPHSRKPALGRKGSSTSIIRDPGDEQVRIVESNIEKNLTLVLMADPDVVRVTTQPEPLYFVDEAGKRFKHTFDVEAELRSGERKLVEVKPSNRVAKYGWKDWIDQISPQVPRSRADSVLLVTELDLPMWLVKNASLILSARTDAPRSVERDIEDYALSVGGALTIRQLTTPWGGPGAVMRAAVRLIYQRRLRLIRPALIDASALVLHNSSVASGVV